VPAVATIERYAIHHEIASGGMATVHFGRLVGPSGFSRTVAIKKAHPHLVSDREFSLMFLDEARLSSRIHHPNVVSTLDVLETPEALLIVMEYIHGESLSRLINTAKERGEGVPAPIAASIVIDALHGLHAAHEAKDEQGEPLGIVHRDVSPQNILVGMDGISRLVDFGIAKAAGRLHQTQNSVVKGKYAYMAPEQVRGEQVSRLTDVYAAGIVFWELLTGERLFLGRTEAETIHKCLAAPVPRPSEIVGGIDPRIDAILDRALARAPAERFASAREMALAIEACMPAVRPSEIGSWVLRISGERLAARADVLAVIEREDSNARGAGARGVSTQETSLASSAVEVKEPSKGHGATSHRAVWLGALAAVLVVFGVILVRTGWLQGAPSGAAASAPSSIMSVATSGDAPQPSTMTSYPSAIAQPAFPSPATPSLKPPGTSAAADPAGDAKTTAPARASEAPPARSGKTGHDSSAPPREKSRASCNPPYTIDHQGNMIFKHECM
jgi:serine/threonine protein kinase